MIVPAQDINKFFSLQILASDKKSYTIKFSVIGNKFEILISNDSSLALTYKVCLQMENFKKLNKFFRQFDTEEEIYDFIVGLEKLEKKVDVTTDDKFVKLTISMPIISKGNSYNNIEIMVPGLEVKEADIIAKLCEKVEKLSLLEMKFNYIFNCLGKKEEDFDIYAEVRFICNKNIKNIESKIITKEDFILPSIGIKKKLNKTIKEVILLYRASKDGDGSAQFHSKCNGKSNTVTFVKTKNDRRFGGFANVAWHSNGSWTSDSNAFIFSLELYECYYYNTGNQIYGHASYGPTWGSGHDLYLANQCLSNNSSTTNQSSYNYYGRTNTLSGGSNFYTLDYETYELVLE